MIILAKNSTMFFNRYIFPVVVFLFIKGISFAQNNPAQLNSDSIQKSLQRLDQDVSILKNLKITGWIQAQYQLTDINGAKTFDGGDFLPNSSHRFTIRRGRVKFTYNQKLSQFVLQLNATERGVNLTEIFFKATEPWTKSLSMTVGVMNRPYGFEIQQSSADRETPERARFTQVLLPNERDMGAMITFQPVKGKKLYGLKADAGFYNGTGIAVPGTTSLNSAGVMEFDNYMDFISRAHYKRSWKEEKIQFGMGVSHYNGGFVYQSDSVYNSISNDSIGPHWNALDKTSFYTNTKAPRIYYGADFQFSIKSSLGTTTIRGEYIRGSQSGQANDSRSPASLPVDKKTFVRHFDGAYFYFIQRIAKSKHEVALKYDWYDPNTDIKGSEIKASNNSFTKADLKYSSLGLGYNYYLSERLKFMLYYNLVTNETSTGIKGYSSDLKDNVLTARIQYRF